MGTVRTLFICILVAAAQAIGGEPRFSLNIHAGGGPTVDPSAEAQRALWNDPMIRLMRAADAEFGHLLVGQPGGRTPPAIVVGFRAGVPPHILGAAIENSLPRTAEPTVTWQWPWAPQPEDPSPALDELIALQLGQRLEQRVGVTADP